MANPLQKDPARAGDTEASFDAALTSSPQGSSTPGFGVGPAPLSTVPRAEAGSLVAQLIDVSSEGLDVQFGHAGDEPSRRALPVVRCSVPEDGGLRELQAQAAPSLTAALSDAQHRRVAALLSVPSTDRHVPQGKLSGNGTALVSYRIADPQLSGAGDASLVLALKIALSADPAKAPDTLTCLMLGTVGGAPLELPVHGYSRFTIDDATVDVLVPNKTYTPDQQAALRAKPEAPCFVRTGDRDGVVSCFFTDANAGLCEATWTVQCDAVLGAWVLSDLDVSPVFAELATLDDTAATTSGASTAAATSQASGWALGSDCNTGSTAQFRQAISRMGIRPHELPRKNDSSRIDGEKVANELLKACDKLTPVTSGDGYAFFGNVKLPEGWNLDPAHEGAAVDITLTLAGSTVSEIRLTNFMPPMALDDDVPTATTAGSAAATASMTTAGSTSTSGLPDWTLDPHFTSRGNASQFRQFLSQAVGLYAVDFPQADTGGADWWQAANGLVKQCRGRTPFSQGPGFVHFDGVPLPRDWQLDGNRDKAVIGITLEYTGSIVTNIRLSNFRMPSQEDVGAVATTATTTAATTTMPMPMPMPAAAAAVAVAASSAFPAAPAQVAHVGLARSFTPKPDSQFRVYLTQSVKLTSQDLPRLEGGMAGWIDWKGVASDLVEACRLSPSGTQASYIATGVIELPEKWSVRPEHRGTFCTVALQVVNDEVVDLLLSNVHKRAPVTPGPM